MVKLSEWARQQNLDYSTVHRWWKEGTLPVEAVQIKKNGTILIVRDSGNINEAPETVIYARVSSRDQAASLDNQIVRLVEWATTNGHSVDRVVKEIGSGLNGRRPKFKKLLSDPNVGTVIAEHRDRFSRFGSEYVEAALAAQGRRLLVTSDDESNDLLQDMTEVLTSLCARFYGKRGAEKRAQAALSAASHAET